MRAVGEFSKGMQRRIGLAQALINDPDLVILDEPTSGLDPIGCREVKDLILALARRGKTVILSSHLLSDVEDVCDRVVIYYGGRIQAMGTLKELLATPDAIRITTPALPRETMERVLEIIRQDVAGDKVGSIRPRRTWRATFSTWCKKRAGPRRKLPARLPARAWRLTCAPALMGAPPAEKILERLALPQAAQPVVPPQPPAPAAAAPKVDDKKLEALTKAADTGRRRRTNPAPAAEEKPVDLSKADEKLSSLLGKKP